MVAARAALVYLSVVALVGAATLTTHRPSGTTTPHAHESNNAHQSHEAPKNHSHSSSTEKSTEQALRDDEDETGNKTAPNTVEAAAPSFELQAVKRAGEAKSDRGSEETGDRDSEETGDRDSEETGDRDSEGKSDRNNGARYEEEGDLYTDVVNGSDDLEELPIPMAQSASKLALRKRRLKRLGPVPSSLAD
nr:dentin sialophosphoprotein-like [Penaeus vannamei]